MTTTLCPSSTPAQVPEVPIAPPPAPVNPRRSPSPIRYPCPARSRGLLAFALAASLGIHAGLIFGIGRPEPKVSRPAEPPLLALTFTMPDLKELEEPESAPLDEPGAKADLGTPAPMLADLPQIPQPTDFVQQIDFSTLIERPDLSMAKVWTIPETIRRGTKPGEGMGNVFNIADLDRVPEPVVQPAPTFPSALKREISRATVVVEFVVDTQGRVFNAFAVESTHPGFEESATTGVQKWRFRAGVKGGVKVNTRMRVPIVFRIVDNEG